VLCAVCWVHVADVWQRMPGSDWLESLPALKPDDNRIRP